VGYHGRSSSVNISGTDVVRPSGQVSSYTSAEQLPPFLPSFLPALTAMLLPSSPPLSYLSSLLPPLQLQVHPTDASQGSSYGPCKLMDFELEMAFFVGGKTNPQGQAISMEEVGGVAGMMMCCAVMCCPVMCCDVMFCAVLC
jgi:hypothetical protein